MPVTVPRHLIGTKQTAAMIGVCQRTLHHWVRKRDKGPRFFRYGHKIFYETKDVEDWIEANTFTPPDARR